MSVTRARLLLDDHHDVPPAPLAAPPAPYGAPPATPQVEEEGEEAEQQDEAADEAAAAAAAPSFSCLALWNWRPNRPRRSPARVGHRCLSRHRRAARSAACSSAEGVRYAASREVSLGTRPRKEFAWLDLEDQRESVRKGCGCALCSALQAQEGIAEPGLAEQALAYCCVYAEIR